MVPVACAVEGEGIGGRAEAVRVVLRVAIGLPRLEDIVHFDRDQPGRVDRALHLVGQVEDQGIGGMPGAPKVRDRAIGVFDAPEFAAPVFDPCGNVFQRRAAHGVEDAVIDRTGRGRTDLGRCPILRMGHDRA